ncbi:hypothetical protein JYU34_000365 [Plutella xylostella]|uniref:Uncharacterized protein n=1 Tax=Plutella xylostella TaxID=51655 RepID=A0ABQ7R7I9_PLUXY|nr:hypothetical protein JYU34_000365 [Plutella xylostella]
MASRDSDQKLPMFTKCDIDLPDNSCDDGNLGYEETLVSSHPAASSVIPAPAPTKKAKPTKKPQDPPITTFQRAWVEMKLNCVDPKTSLNVVKTMKAEVLSALVNSNLLPSDLTDKLEMQWVGFEVSASGIDTEYSCGIETRVSVPKKYRSKSIDTTQYRVLVK